MPGEVKTGPLPPKYSQSRITQKPADAKKHHEPKTQKPQEGTFAKLFKPQFDSERLDQALRTQLNIQNVRKETAGTHRLPVNLDDTHLWSYFGNREHPDTGKIKFHKGIDLGGKRGDPVRATAYGTVVFAGKSKSYGKHVIIEHKDGTRTMYAHLHFISLKKGQEVKAGGKVGGVGNTGATGGRKHLHIEFSRPATPADKNLPKNHRGEVLLDPLEYLPKKEVAILIKRKEIYEGSLAKNNNKKGGSALLAMRHGHSH